jgi:hypothetical protein
VPCGMAHPCERACYLGIVICFCLLIDVCAPLQRALDSPPPPLAVLSPVLSNNFLLRVHSQGWL